MTTTIDLILYHAARYLAAEKKYSLNPCDKNKKAFEVRKAEISRVVSKLSVRQGNLFEE